jgi:hypothetical protein
LPSLMLVIAQVLLRLTPKFRRAVKKFTRWENQQSLWIFLP